MELAESMDTKADDVESKNDEKPECKEFDKALDIQDTHPDEAVLEYFKVISMPDPLLAKLKEESVYNITKILSAKSGDSDSGFLRRLLTQLQDFFNTLAKAKTAKIVRQVVEIVGRGSAGINLQAAMCTDAIEWCIQEKRTFLKQRLQTRLAALLMKQGKFKESIKLINEVVKEVKKFDDKMLLVEVNLLESRVYYALNNVAKSKGALTSARANANTIYCPPLLQSEIDLQAGILCAEEKDFKTAFSYFYEAFEGYSSISYVPEATQCLKYMLLTKIIADHAEDVYSIINGKVGVKYAGPAVEAMRAVANAHKNRSIDEFEAVSTKFQAELSGDPLINTHLTDLKEALLQQNLLRLLEPFSRVQIDHVAKLINLPTKHVEHKLSEMILDKKIDGILDQGTGTLIIYESQPQSQTYGNSLSTIKELSAVVDRLYDKAKRCEGQ